MTREPRRRIVGGKRETSLCELSMFDSTKQHGSPSDITQEQKEKDCKSEPLQVQEKQESVSFCCNIKIPTQNPMLLALKELKEKEHTQTEKDKKSYSKSFIDSDTMKQQRYALGLCRILKSPIEYIEEEEENKETEKIHEDKNNLYKTSSKEGGLEQDVKTIDENYECLHNEKECENQDSSTLSKSDSPLVQSEEDKTICSDDSSIYDSEDNEDIDIERYLQVIQVKLENITDNIDELEKELKASDVGMHNIEKELKHVSNIYSEKEQTEKEIQSHLMKEEEWEKLQHTTMERLGEDTSRKDESEIEKDMTKTDDETFFSLTPSDASEDDKTFHVCFEKKDVATEISDDDDVMKKVEENHSDLLLNCLVR